MPGPDLADKTRRYYDDLINEIGDQYITFRWNSNRIGRAHYKHTSSAIEEAFKDRIGQVGHLLEVGCGPGTWTHFCLLHAKRVTLFDISEEMLRLAKKRFGDRANVDFICGDFVTHSPSGNTLTDLDAIFSARALEYMTDKAAMVRRCFKKLRPGGTLAIITKNPRCATNSVKCDGPPTPHKITNMTPHTFSRTGFTGRT